MTIVQALAAFLVAATLLTITPGLDTAMILRTAAAEGPRKAALAGVGICAGCFAWGLAVALGLGALLAASETAYKVLKWVGAAYLVWMGLNMILKPRSRIDLDSSGKPGGGKTTGGGGVFVKGLLNNLLNPKIGVFYVSFLPQFTPPGVMAAPFIVLLVAIHVALTTVWFACLIGATRPLKRWISQASVVRWLDRVTGGVFIAFGARLAMDHR